LLARTFLAVFPQASLFMLNQDEAALIGSPGPLTVDLARLQGRLSAAAVQQSLRSIGFLGASAPELAREILALAPLHGRALADLAGAGPLVTDDRPLVETFAATLTLSAAELDSTADEPGRDAFVKALLATPWRALPMRNAVAPDLSAHLSELRRALSR
jgi:hypothetical protein